MKLIVGLGNPGSGYEQTRHNAGFWFVDALAEQNNADFRHDKRFHGHVASVECRFHGHVASVEWHGERVYLLKPATYMNRSGLAVAAMSRFYRIQTEDILIAHDELDLGVGALRVKSGGGHGGHNGLRDIITACGNDAGFMRLRIGIGHPGNSKQVVDYVLRKPSADERVEIEAAIKKAVELMPTLHAGDVQQVQQTLHSRQ